MLEDVPRFAVPFAAIAMLAVAVAVSACSASTSGTPRRTPPADVPTSPGVTAPPSSSTPYRATGGRRHARPTAKTSSPSAAVHPAPSEPLRSKDIDASDGSNYLIQVWAQKRTTDCSGNAFGAPVIDFLDAHPCSGLTQVLATTTIDGRAVGIAQDTIGFEGDAPKAYRVATEFNDLVGEDGTGNLDDLMRNGYRLPAGPPYVPASNAFDVEAQDASVTVVDAWYLTGATPDDDPALVKMARDVFLQY